MLIAKRAWHRSPASTTRVATGSDRLRCISPRDEESLMRRSPTDIEAHIAGFPRNVQTILKKIRATIRGAAPNATESISYRIPTFKANGARIYFAAFQSHISLYPVTPDVKAKFKELSRYKGGTGTVRFPLD